MKIEDLPRPANYRRQITKNGGYEMVPAYTAEEVLGVLEGGERLLRQMLAIRVAGAILYADDGELQDNSVQPFIDFKRDSAKEIERKLLERGMAKAWKSIGQFVQSKP